jgi:hypothetical protein
VSPEHALYLDNVLVPARLLINGMTITQVAAIERLEYFHIELDTHDIIFAEETPAETYIECDNRLMFHNAYEFVALYPNAQPGRWQFCAPRLEACDATVAAIRERLFARAAALGQLKLTSDPGLHLIADGIAVPPHVITGDVYHFAVSRQRGAVLLASRSAVPAETGVTSTDCRRLGVCIRRITLRDTDLTLDLVPGHHMLRAGFHEREGEHRWTDGMARLPQSVIELFTAPLHIEVALWPSKLFYTEPAAMLRA